MNLTGARWRLTGAEVLRLRALRSSNDFDAYWKFHEQQEYERHHASHYADHRVPETVPSPASSSRPSRRGTLKIVSCRYRGPNENFVLVGAVHAATLRPTARKSASRSSETR